MCHDHVPVQRRHFVECLVTVAAVAVVDQLTVNTKWFAVLLSLMSNEMIFAEECFVTVLILAQKVLTVIVSCMTTPIS